MLDNIMPEGLKQRIRVKKNKITTIIFCWWKTFRTITGRQYKTFLFVSWKCKLHLTRESKTDIVITKRPGKILNNYKLKIASWQNHLPVGDFDWSN